MNKMYHSNNSSLQWNFYLFCKNGLQKIFDLIFSASINYKSLSFIAVLDTGFRLSPKDSFCPSMFTEEKPI